jgi:tetratricopeptide (TPR) repeat protein
VRHFARPRLAQFPPDVGDDFAECASLGRFLRIEFPLGFGDKGIAMLPRFFISAVSRELRGAREVAARVLRTLGYEVVYQDEFPLEAGDLRGVLREKIDGCAGVLQLVGQAYGFAPKDVDPEYGPVSYTQYEAEYARRAGKRVWYLLLDADFTSAEAAPAEGAAERELQLAYRRKIETGSHLYHTVAAPAEMELRIHQLRDELKEFRARMERRSRLVVLAAIVGMVLVALTVRLVIKVIDDLKKERAAAATEAKTQAERDEKLLAALREIPERLAGSSKMGGGTAEKQADVFAALEQEHGLASGTLARELPGFAATLLSRKETALLDRANALYVEKRYAEAEAAALKAKDEALDPASPRLGKAVDALVLASLCARRQLQSARSLEHNQAAAVLLSEEREPQRWANLQHEIVFDLGNLGRYDEAVALARKLVPFLEKHLGPDHIDTMGAVNNLASLLKTQDQSAEAEALFRRVLEASDRTLGKDHKVTLVAVNNLASAVAERGDMAEGERLFRRALEGRERTLGKEHEQTLVSRTNVAYMLAARGETVEAEKLYREAAETSSRVLGKDAVTTLAIQRNLADLLAKKHEDREAEALFRAAVESCERVFGKKHPQTWSSVMALAEFLHERKRDEEVKALAREAYDGWKAALGVDHASTKRAATVLRELGETP